MMAFNLLSRSITEGKRQRHLEKYRRYHATHPATRYCDMSEEQKIARRLAVRRYAERHPDRIATYKVNNKDKLAAGIASWRKRNPDKQAVYDRRQALKKNYGLTLEVYSEMLASQSGRCASCGDPPGHYKLAVDHCHKTGRVRGLLCSRCNTALGQLKEDFNRIERLANYLKERGN